MSKIKNASYIILIVVILIFIASGIILSCFLNKKEPVNISQEKDIKKEEVQKEEEPAPVISAPLEEIWEEYTNHQLGFSMKFPQIVSGTNGCSDETIRVPVRVFEDNENGIVYITPEYYYDDWDRESQTKTGPCKKTVYSLESLPVSGWKILIEDIKSESELNKFVKDNYGPGCFAGEKELWKQEGVYEIRRKGEDWGPGVGLGTTTCPWHYTYKILYAPEKNKLMSVNLGQECDFGTDHSSKSFKCYEDEMIDSFRFE